jgi:hypothetical protein
LVRGEEGYFEDEIVCAQDDRYGAGVAGGTGSSTSEKNKKECQGFSLFKHLISTLPNYRRRLL